MATLKEIAQLAGVSRGTVDRVINHRGSVNPETENRIRAIIKELNYKPNKAGIALAAQKKKYRICIILFSRKNPYFDEVCQGFEDKAEELSVYGCEIKIVRVAYHPEAQLSAISACLKEGFDGLIITPYNDERIRNECNRLSRGGIPVITTNTDIENANRLCYVGSNYYTSGQAAGALMDLMTSGPVCLGVVSGDPAILCHSQRVAGLVDKLTDQSRFKITAHAENYDDDQTSYEVVTKMLSSHPEINAFYFTAAGVYGGCRAIMEHGKGKKITVIAFDDVPSTVEMMQKDVITATICQEPYWQGSKSLDVMFQHLTNPEIPIEENYFAKLTIKIKEIS